MNENDERDIGFNIEEIFFIFRRNVILMIFIAVLFGIAAGCYTEYRIPRTYTTAATMCAYSDKDINDRISIDGRITSSEIAASQGLVNTYLEIIRSKNFLEKVAADVDYNISAGAIGGMISCSQIEDTFVFKVYVTSTNPQQAADIANTIAELAPDEIVRIITVGSVKVIDYATVPGGPSGPDKKRNIMLASIAGFAITFIIVFLRYMLDTSVNVEGDLESQFDIPVLGSVPRLKLVDEPENGKRKNK